MDFENSLKMGVKIGKIKGYLRQGRRVAAAKKIKKYLFL